MPMLSDYYRRASSDLFEKCRAFDGFVQRTHREGHYRSVYRLELVSPLDHRIRVRDPLGGAERDLTCFDSNSYLGLHLHRRVLQAVRSTLEVTGYGTPSAQLLAGNNRWLRELEEVVSTFHGRPATLVFPSGYAANVGILTGLLRPGDRYACHKFSHASVHDGCKWSGAEGDTFTGTDELESIFVGEQKASCGRLLVSDGVFSMHGRTACLPALRAACDRHGARLMIDEAHSVGVLGATGRGLEEQWGMSGAIDLLMGTFSKAPGALGGYVCGSAEVIEYLRFFARSSVFTASLPAPLCAGIAEAFRVMEEEPELREALWDSARYLHTSLVQVGFQVAPLESPILTVPIGASELLLEVGTRLLERGFRCGAVMFPAVPRDGALLRVTANARHTREEIDGLVDALSSLGRERGFLGRSLDHAGVA